MIAYSILILLVIIAATCFFALGEFVASLAMIGMFVLLVIAALEESTK